MKKIVDTICSENAGIMWKQEVGESYRDRMFRAGVEATLSYIEKNGVYRIDTQMIKYPYREEAGSEVYLDIFDANEECKYMDDEGIVTGYVTRMGVK